MFPTLSVTEHDTVVEPNANVEPDEGVQVGANGPSTRSEPEAAYVTTAPVGPVASAIMSAGTVITGGMLSARAKRAVTVPAPCIVTVVDADELLKTIDAVSLDHDE
jgi:hypothetical protein